MMAEVVNFSLKESNEPERLVYRLGQSVGWLAAAVGAQTVPVKGVVPYLGRIVEDAPR